MKRADLDLLKGHHDGKTRLMVISNDYARMIIIPRDKPDVVDTKVINQSNYKRLENIKNRPTPQDKQAHVRRIMEVNEKRERELEKQIKNIGLEGMYQPKMSKLEAKQEEERTIRNRYIKKRAKELKLEEEDVMKVLNMEITNARCATILEKQIAQKAVKNKIEKTLDTEAERKIVDEDETNFVKEKTNDDERKEEDKRKLKEFLDNQVKVKEMTRKLRKEEIDKEVIRRKLIMAQESKKEMEELRKKVNDKKNLMQSQKDLITEKLIEKQKEREEDDVMAKNLNAVLNKQDEREKLEKERSRKEWKERHKAQEELIKQRKEQNIQNTIEEDFKTKRRDNELDRIWRLKEKERILKELEAKKQFRDGIEMQVQDKYEQKTKELISELEEVDRMKDNLKKVESANEEDKKRVIGERNDCINVIVQQIKDKQRAQERERIENELFIEKLKENEEKWKDNLLKALDDKLEHLQNYDINEKGISMVKRKAKALRKTIE